jgi:hypothetical protein
MAYDFDGNNQFLSVGSAPATAAPLTLAFWFNKDTTNTKNCVFLINQSTQANYFGIYMLGATLRGETGDGFTSTLNATGSYSASTWTHACYVEASTTSRTIYRDGGDSATNTVSRSPSGINRLYIGTFSGAAANFDGLIAEVGVWSAALTQPEIASLAKGMTCDKVRPQSLVFYSPLTRDLIDYKGGLAITNNNTATVANHPRVYA